ncbi:cupin domain-containing protein [Hyphomicrobium sp. ghe19]|uniref:cupin domain-containing protein n=1 Tax=Hyphomicrobium sp. ghe19 TaxID=2682968 RepID=UPI001366E372|nr:HTH-type transcriptional regulator PuuR [Hyphomicrobium sp. ghe19]
MVRTKTSEGRAEVLEQVPPEADVRLGRRIRAARLERKLGLSDVAQRAGISVGALSQIERGISSLRVRVLWPLAAALGVEPHSLLAESQDDGGDLYVVRSAHRKDIPVRSEGIHKELLSPPGSVLTGLLVSVDPDCGTGHSYSHAGHEFGIVRKGQFELTIDSVVYLLKAGDSFAFKSTLEHSFRNRGKERCEIVWINTAKPNEIANGA